MIWLETLFKVKICYKSKLVGTPCTVYLFLFSNQRPTRVHIRLGVENPNQSTIQAPFKIVLNATGSTLKTLPGFTNPTPLTWAHKFRSVATQKKNPHLTWKKVREGLLLLLLLLLPKEAASLENWSGDGQARDFSSPLPWKLRHQSSSKLPILDHLFYFKNSYIFILRNL